MSTTESPADPVLASLPGRVRDAWQEEVDRDVPVAAAAPSGPRPGRNEACHCGSGRKYKKCCQVADEARSLAGERSTRLPEEALAALRRADRRAGERDAAGYRAQVDGCLGALAAAGNAYWQAWCAAIAGDAGLALPADEPARYYQAGWELAQRHGYTALAGQAATGMGLALAAAGRWAEGAAWLAKAREVAALREHGRLEGMLFVAEAECRREAGEPVEAALLLAQVEEQAWGELYPTLVLRLQIDVLRQAGDATGERTALGRLARAHLRRGEKAEAAGAVLALARLEVEAGEAAGAVDRLERLVAELRADPAGDPALFPEAYYQLGRAAEATGRPLRAIECYQHALDARPEGHRRSAAELYERLAEVHLQREDARGGLFALAEGQAAALAAGDRGEAARLCVREAELLYAARKKDAAVQRLEAALPWLDAGDPALAWPAHLTLAEWRLQARQPDTALAQAEAAWQALERDPGADAWAKLDALLLLAEVRERLSRWEPARDAYRRAVAEARHARSAPAMFAAMAGLARAAAALGEHEEARRRAGKALALHQRAALPPDAAQAACLAIQAAEPPPREPTQATPVDLSLLTLTVLGGEASDRRLLRRVLEERHALGELIEVPPSWYGVHAQKDVDAALRRADLAVLLTGCTKHDLSYLLRDYHRRHPGLPILYVHGGLTGAVRAICRYFTTR